MEEGSKLSPKRDEDEDEDDSVSKPCLNFTKNVFCILPEIWDQILDYLTPAEFLAIINTCPQWRNMLRTHTPNNLLPLVLPVLMNHWSVSEESLLCWRQVNRKAKLFIETQLEESPPQYFETLTNKLVTKESLTRQDPLQVIVKKIQSRYDFVHPRKMEQFTNYVESKGLPQEMTTPFLTKSVFLTIVDHQFRFDSFPNLDPILMNMMHKLGYSVSKINFHLANVNVSYFFSLLGHLPNLKILKITGAFTLEPRYEGDLERLHVDFQNLNILDVEEFREFMGPQVEGLRAALLKRCCPQLETFVCSKDFFRNEINVSTLNSACFPSLRRLRVNKADLGVFAAFSQMKDLPLEEIQVVTESWWNGTIQIHQVVQAVDAFAETLTHLQLFVSPNADRNQELQKSNWVVCLPKLKTFTTTWQNVNTRWFPLFIKQKCRNLSLLNLHGEFHDDELSGFRRSWEKVGQMKLKNVRFCCGIGYKRNCYQ